MSFYKPFHRNYRPQVEKPYSGYSDWAYIIDPEYSQEPKHYTRAFFIIQEDLLKLFQFVEPADTNNFTYSFRIHDLFMRICMEVEANFRAIFKENTYLPVYQNGPRAGELRPENKWNINDFKLINKTHHLDDYEITLPFWKGSENKRKPFLNWKYNQGLEWYQAYNKAKHDRINNFDKANLKNLLDAFSGLGVLLSSQFRHVDFQPGPDNLTASGYCYYGGGFGIGDYLIVDFPDNWSEEEMYDFDWNELQGEDVKFSKFDYNSLLH